MKKYQTILLKSDEDYRKASERLAVIFEADSSGTSYNMSGILVQVKPIHRNDRLTLVEMIDQCMDKLIADRKKSRGGSPRTGVVKTSSTTGGTR